MKKIWISAAWTVVTVLALSALARAERVRITLQNGDVVTGELLEHKGKIYRVRVGKTQRRLHERDVKRVERLPKQPPRISIEASDEALGAVMKRIAKAAGVTITVDSGIAQHQVNVHLRDIPWDEAVEVIARMSRCEVERRKGSLHLLRIPKVTFAGRDLEVQGVLKTIAAAGKARLVLGPQVRGRVALDVQNMRWRDALTLVAYVAALEVRDQAGSLQVKARPDDVRPAPPKLAPRGKPITTTPQDKKVSVSFKDIDLSEAMELLGKKVDRNILVDPDVQVRLTLAQTDTPWTEIVKRAALATQCDVEVRPGGILLFTQPPKNRIRAAKAPAGAFFLTLAKYAQRNVVVAPEVRAAISCDLTRVYWGKALETIARAHKFNVVRLPGGAVAIVGAKFDPRARRAALTSVDPSQLGKTKLQAVFAAPEFSAKHPGVIIGGRVYRASQKLRDAAGGELPVTVDRIGPASVVLRSRSMRKTVIKFR